MFFGQQDNEDITKYIKEEWVSLSQVYEKILESNSTLFLKGYGFINHEKSSQFIEFLGYYLIHINGNIFGFCGESIKGETLKENELMNFKSVVEFDASILKSSILMGNQFKSSQNYYKKFDADLLIEAKIYQYHDEEKLLLSKAGQGNIDLYCSYQIKNNTNEFVCKIHPSAFSTAKYLAMSQILEERIQNMKK